MGRKRIAPPPSKQGLTSVFLRRVDVFGSAADVVAAAAEGGVNEGRCSEGEQLETGLSIKRQKGREKSQ